MQSDAPNNVADEYAARRGTKRQRVSRACAPCRYAKLRCDGQQPTCTTCRQQDKRCAYEASFKRRGLRCGYVRALELLWGLTLNEVESAESVVDELLGRLSKQDLTASSDRTDSTTPASILLDRWKQSEVARHIDVLLNGNDEQHAESDEGGIQDELQQPDSGGKPYWKVVRNENLQSCQPEPRRDLPEAQPQASALGSGLDHLQGTGSNLQPPTYAPQLLQLFFRCGQSWLPILERHVTLKTAFQYSVDSSLLHEGDRSALWAVYAYTSTTLSHLLPNKHAHQHAHVQSNAFYAQAYSMLPLDSDHPVELGHIQCGALLALTRLSSGATTAAWRLMKLSIQMLREMTEQQQTATEHEALARAWLVCFILDTISSACRQATPSLSYDDVAKYLQIDENGLEEWQPWQRPRTSQDQDMSSDMTADIPTHSLGMLVLQAKLLRFLNGNLHLQSASWELNGSELEQWNRDLSNYLLRTGLATVLGNKDLNLLALPPSFMGLGIIYTALVNQTTCIGTFAATAGDAALGWVDYPLLSHTTLQNLRKDDDFRKTFPVLHLLSSRLRDDDLSLIPNEPSNTTRQDFRANGLGPNSRLPQFGPQPVQTARDIQGRTLPTGLSLSANPSQPDITISEQGPGSEIPMIDDYVFPTDAPFLEFMDGLDDRSM